MRFVNIVLLLWSAPIVICAVKEEFVTYRAVQRCIGSKENDNATDCASFAANERFSLAGSIADPGILVLDYGSNVEGHPVFRVVSTSGDTSALEVTYSESKPVLDNYYMSDGPISLAAAMETYRVNRFNLSGPLNHTNRLIQGAFRYQKFNISSNGEIILMDLGVKPTIPNTPLNRLAGHFECSDDDLNRIWGVGARTVQLNDIPANSIPPFWQVSPEGSLVESQAPQVLAGAEAAFLMQYNLIFSVKPIKRGFAFSVLADTLNEGIYISCAFDEGSISAHFGSTADSPILASGNLPSNLTLGQWHTVNATINISDIIVLIDGMEVLNFSQTSSFFGAFGLGASFGHSALFRDLAATTLDGQPVYSSTLTDESFFDDFNIGTNPLDVAVDGSKRDRIAYAGDLDIALESSLASTNGTSYIEGTLALIGSFQLTPGFFVPTAKIQQSPHEGIIAQNITGLIGYSFNLLTAAAQFYQRTGNESFARQWATKAVRMLDWAHSQTLSQSGLLNISDASFGGDWNYYDPVQSGVVSKFNMVYAYTLQECIGLLTDGGIDALPYTARLRSLRAAINEHLWSAELNAFYLSESRSNGFGQDSNALAILAGVTSANDATETVLSTLKQLNQPSGPLAFSEEITSSGFAKFISPYASAYHLRAALESGNDEVAIDLLKRLWLPMADPKGVNYTGCFWETLDAFGGPALGKMTSLCHGWASAPTGELSEHVLGIQAMTPGYKKWRVAPTTLGLEWAQGAMPVPGGHISVSWNATKGMIDRIELMSPAGTTGTVVIPTRREPSEGGVQNTKRAESSEREIYHIQGGHKYVLTCISSCSITALA